MITRAHNDIERHQMISRRQRRALWGIRIGMEGWDQNVILFAGIAEFERELIRQRTDEGRQAARKCGVTFGRPPKLRPDQQALAARLLREGRSVSEVARTFNVHPATIYRCIEMPVLRPRLGSL